MGPNCKGCFQQATTSLIHKTAYYENNNDGNRLVSDGSTAVQRTNSKQKFHVDKGKQVYQCGR